MSRRIRSPVGQGRGPTVSRQEREPVLTTKAPITGDRVTGEYYVVADGGRYLGRVRRNWDDGQWVAGFWPEATERHTLDALETLAGSWRQRAAAVADVVGAAYGGQEYPIASLR